MTRTPEQSATPSVGLAIADPALRSSLRMLLSAHGIGVHEFPGFRAFLACVPLTLPDCLVVDMKPEAIRSAVDALRDNVPPIVALAPWNDSRDEPAGLPRRIQVVSGTCDGETLVRHVLEAAGAATRPLPAARAATT